MEEEKNIDEDLESLPDNVSESNNIYSNINDSADYHLL